MNMEIIRNYINNRLSSAPSLSVKYGVVISIDPLKIKLNKDTIITGKQILLTEGVIRKEFHIAVHTHWFEEDTFVHEHSDGNKLILGTDWDIKALMYNGGLVAPAPSAAIPPSTMAIQGSASTGQIDLKNGQKKYDLSHDAEDDFETLPNPKPTESTVTVKINGEVFPLTKDKDGETEDDVDGNDKYWAVLNYGLHKDDVVILLSLPNNNVYVVLSKLYEVDTSKFQEEEN